MNHVQQLKSEPVRGLGRQYQKVQQGVRLFEIGSGRPTDQHNNDDAAEFAGCFRCGAEYRDAGALSGNDARSDIAKI